MTINEIRDLLAEEFCETEAYIDQMYAVSDGDQFPVEDLTLKATLKDLLRACSEEQIEARKAAIIAARHHEMEDESPPF